MTGIIIVTLVLGIGMVSFGLRSPYSWLMAIILLIVLGLYTSNLTVPLADATEPKQWPREDLRYHWWDMENTGCM